MQWGTPSTTPEGLEQRAGGRCGKGAQTWPLCSERQDLVSLTVPWPSSMPRVPTLPSPILSLLWGWGSVLFLPPSMARAWGLSTLVVCLFFVVTVPGPCCRHRGQSAEGSPRPLTCTADELASGRSRQQPSHRARSWARLLFAQAVHLLPSILTAPQSTDPWGPQPVRQPRRK